MTMFSKILIGTAGLAATVAIAAPAAAQGYPYGYGQQQQNSGGVVGAIVNAVTGGGYGQYPRGNYGYGQVSQRASVQQCAAAAEYRLNGGNRGQGYGNQGYRNQGYGNQYGYGNQGYAQGNARVVGITHVERRRNGGVHVVGVASSGQGYGGYGNQGYANQGYGNQGYGNQGYGYASQQGDVSFNCKVNSRGQVSDVRINRLQRAYRRGY